MVWKDYSFIVSVRTLASVSLADLTFWVTDHDGKNGHALVFPGFALTASTSYTTPISAVAGGGQASQTFDGPYLIHSAQWTRTSTNSSIPDVMWTRISFVNAITESSNHDVYRTIEWFTDSNSQSSWPDAGERKPFFGGENGENGVVPRIFTWQGTVANGAGGAGDQTYTVAAPSGGRFELLAAQLTNNDTAARVCGVQVTDGTNQLYQPMIGASIAAANSVNLPQIGAAQTAGNVNGLTRIVIAGGHRLIFTVVAVAASQDSALGLVLKFWGGAPTVTPAGASTPVLTTNTSQVEAG